MSMADINVGPGKLAPLLCGPAPPSCNELSSYSGKVSQVKPLLQRQGSTRAMQL